MVKCAAAKLNDAESLCSKCKVHACRSVCMQPKGHAPEFPTKSSFSSCSKITALASAAGVTLRPRLNRGHHARSVAVKTSKKSVT